MPVVYHADVPREPFRGGATRKPRIGLVPLRNPGVCGPRMVNSAILLERDEVPPASLWLKDVARYERAVTSKRR